MEIEQYSFGRIVVAGAVYTEDIKIVSGRVVPGWFRKSGHRVEPDDVLDILAEKPDVLVLGKGDPGRMTASASLIDRLGKEAIELIEKPTKEAAEIFNRLSGKRRRIAAGFHLTC
jgi:hypothetical protein